MHPVCAGIVLGSVAAVAAATALAVLWRHQLTKVCRSHHIMQHALPQRHTVSGRRTDTCAKAETYGLV